MNFRSNKVFIAGHNGMVGSAILRKLKAKGFNNILTATFSELDLRSQKDTKDFFEVNKPDVIILAAAKVGGINANVKYPADFIYNNLMIQNNVIHSAYLTRVKKIVFLGSSCIYPKECPQPMKEEYLLTGKLEPTNEGYALAKISGLKMLEFYNKQYGLDSLSLMPCNLYGPGDSFDLEHSHVLSALVKRFVDAKTNGDREIILWGTGIARREFMHVDDLAEALLFLMQNYASNQFINIGWGKDISIKELAEVIAMRVGYSGKIIWDGSKPDGMLRKCLDTTRLNSLGYFPSISLSEGVKQMINLYYEKSKVKL